MSDTPLARRIAERALKTTFDQLDASVVHETRRRVLDSIGTLKLVSFLEETFNIQIKAHEADFSNLNTISDIAGLVHTKLETG